MRAVRQWAPGTGPRQQESCPSPQDEEAWITVPSQALKNQAKAQEEAKAQENARKAQEEVKNQENARKAQEDEDDDDISEEECSMTFKRKPMVKHDQHLKKQKQVASYPTTAAADRPSGSTAAAGGYRNLRPSGAAANAASTSREAGSSRAAEVAAEDDQRAAVLRTLRIFEQVRRHQVMLQQATKGKGQSHVTAMNIVKSRGLALNSSACIGSVPGVEVGDIFCYRTAMNVIGLHGPLQGGICTVNAASNKWGVIVANSIILSGGYEDDLDQGETFVYTGSGGNICKGNRKQCVDQELLRGNKALLHSFKLEIPVRVIRGCTDDQSPSKTTYSYDGLYKIRRHWEDFGKSGHKVFKFDMERCAGQRRLASGLVTFNGAQAKKMKSQVLQDISGGSEADPINVVNDVNKCPAPTGFKYVPAMDHAGYGLSLTTSSASCCDCRGPCRAPSCRCIAKNAGILPYTSDGTLVSTRTIVYECSQRCRCLPNCITRVSQHGISRKLQVFRTLNKGWGLRSWQTIPGGSFVCEIIGQVVSSKSLASADRHYVFNIDCINKSQNQRIDVSSYFDEPELVPDVSLEKSGLFLDASRVGNVSRFINHSCCPNLLVQCVLYDHMDSRLPHLMLFAPDNIRPFQELTFDYATVMDLEDRCVACHCGERVCRKWI